LIRENREGDLAARILVPFAGLYDVAEQSHDIGDDQDGPAVGTETLSRSLGLSALKCLLMSGMRHWGFLTVKRPAVDRDYFRHCDRAPTDLDLQEDRQPGD
jgi:hypothetical protein